MFNGFEVLRESGWLESNEMVGAKEKCSLTFE